LLCLLAATAAWLQRAKSPAHLLVGSWRYDLASIHVALTAKAGHKAEALSVRKEVLATLKTITLIFRANRTLQTKDAGHAAVTTGSWTLFGPKIIVHATNLRQKMPAMELSKDGRRIHAVDSEPGLGVVKVDLVKLPRQRIANNSR